MKIIPMHLNCHETLPTVKMIYYVLSVVGLLLASLIYLYFPRKKIIIGKFSRTEPTAVSLEIATKALERVGSWASWVAGIQTTAIAFMGFIIKDKGFKIAGEVKISGYYTCFFWGVYSPLLLSIARIARNANPT